MKGDGVKMSFNKFWKEYAERSLKHNTNIAKIAREAYEAGLMDNFSANRHEIAMERVNDIFTRARAYTIDDEYFRYNKLNEDFIQMVERYIKGDFK